MKKVTYMFLRFFLGFLIPLFFYLFGAYEAIDNFEIGVLISILSLFSFMTLLMHRHIVVGFLYFLLWVQGIFIYQTLGAHIGFDYLILTTIILLFLLNNSKRFYPVWIFILVSFCVLEFIICGFYIFGADQPYLEDDLKQSIFIDIVDFLETQSKVSGCVGDDEPKKSFGGGMRSFFGVDRASPTPPPQPSIIWQSAIDSAKFPSEVSKSLNKGTELLESATKVLTAQHKEAVSAIAFSKGFGIAAIGLGAILVSNTSPEIAMANKNAIGLLKGSTWLKGGGYAFATVGTYEMVKETFRRSWGGS